VQPLAALAAGTIFLLAALGPVLDTLGNRGYRAAQLEADIRTGRIYLGAYASGCAATASTFYDDGVTRFVAPGTGKSPLLRCGSRLSRNVRPARATVREFLAYHRSPSDDSPPL